MVLLWVEMVDWQAAVEEFIYMATLSATLLSRDTPRGQRHRLRRGSWCAITGAAST